MQRSPSFIALIALSLLLGSNAWQEADEANNTEKRNRKMADLSHDIGTEAMTNFNSYRFFINIA